MGSADFRGSDCVVRAIRSDSRSRSLPSDSAILDQALLKASTTRRRIACRAGKAPPSTPMKAAKPNACKTIDGVIRKLNASVENVKKFAKLVEKPLIGI